MPYFTCPYCNKRSYSAADVCAWICPYCNSKVNQEDSEENKNQEQEN